MASKTYGRLPEVSLDIAEDLPIVGSLSDEDKSRLQCPASVTDFQRQKLERDAKKNWDLFYKRNGDRFFKRRYWTRREFAELIAASDGSQDATSTNYLLEIGCGCGDFLLPLLEPHDSDNAIDAKLASNLFIYCCDISEVAVSILASNPVFKRHHPARVKAFVADITDNNGPSPISAHLEGRLMDFVSLIFVMSALDPDRMPRAIENISCLLKPNGLVLFRDYAIYDKAMIRFKEQSKIAEQFYVRQDGTRAYFFTKSQLVSLFSRCRFQCESICYIERETINNATQDKHSRIFLQAKFRNCRDNSS